MKKPRVTMMSYSVSVTLPEGWILAVSTAKVVTEWFKQHPEKKRPLDTAYYRINDGILDVYLPDGWVLWSRDERWKPTEEAEDQAEPEDLGDQAETDGGEGE